MHAMVCISSMIGIIVFVQCVEGRIEKPENRIALRFGYQWLKSPKMYLGIMVPSKRHFRTRNVVNVAKKINAGYMGRPSFIMINSNLSKYNVILHQQDELLWYPFNINDYGMDCLFSDSSRYDRLHKKHFLFLYEDMDNDTFPFESCKIRFDSRFVLYHKKQKKRLVVEFEEIYKINESENRLEKNILGEIFEDQMEIMVPGLKNPIWKRRQSLKGTFFTAVSKNRRSWTLTVKKYKDLEGNQIIHYSGYIPDIMRQLIQILNFSLITHVSNLPFNDIVMEVGSGRYDIGYQSFSHSFSRSNHVDFSFGLWKPSYGLFYVKENQKCSMGTFLHPFTSPTWSLVTTYIVVIVIGNILVEIIIGRHAHLSVLKKISESLQQGSDIVLRSLIAKRQCSEPQIWSYKISFIIIVLAGYVIFTMYRAALVAFLAAEEDNPPIGNLKELVNSDYSLALRKGTIMDARFSNAVTGSDEYQVNKNEKIVKFTEPLDKILDLMVGNDPKASNTILFDIYETVRTSEHYPCRLSQITGSSRKTWPDGLLFKKNWPWTDFFNYHLLAMKESGWMDRLYQQNMKKMIRACPNEHTINRIVKEPRPVGTDKTFSLYVALVIGLVISLLLLLVENLVA